MVPQLPSYESQTQDDSTSSGQGQGQGQSSGQGHPGQISGMFSYLSSIREDRELGLLAPRRLLTSLSHSSSWADHHQNGPFDPSLSSPPRSLWTKYCLLCTLCGSAATILAGIFLVIAALFRYYTTSINYFETVPTYIPAILLSIVGVSTIAFSCKRNRNIILLRITACWSLLSAALSSVITITTSVIHMNRLQTLKECVYSRDPAPACSCYSEVFRPLSGLMQVNEGHDLDLDPLPQGQVSTYVFENTPDCDVIHGILYSCLRAVFAISVVSVLLSIFLCMLLYQLIGHERKKAYWSRIRRINSDWSADFIACLARPLPRDRSSILPLMSGTNGPGSISLSSSNPGGGIGGWGPPPPYEEVESLSSNSNSNLNPNCPSRRLRLVTSHSDNFLGVSVLGPRPGPHPFSPTIALDPYASTNSSQGHLCQGQGQGQLQIQTHRPRRLCQAHSQGQIQLQGQGQRPRVDVQDQSQSQGNVNLQNSVISISTNITNSITLPSITSLSVGTSFSNMAPNSNSNSNHSTLSTLEEDYANANACADADGASALPAQDSTCKSLTSGNVFGSGSSLELLDFEMDFDAKIRLLDEKLALARIGENNTDFKKKINHSLPCSPMVDRVKKFLNSKGSRKSAQNLLSFANINWSQEEEEEENKQGEGIRQNFRATTSLPTTPLKRRKIQEKTKNEPNSNFPDISSIMHKSKSNNNTRILAFKSNEEKDLLNYKKLSLDEQHFLYK